MLRRGINSDEHVPVLDAESDGASTSASEFIRRQTRSARMIATAALAFTAVAAVCMCIVLFRVEDNMAQASPGNSVGLNTIEVGAAFDKEDASLSVEGWYTTYLNALVQTSPDMESRRVGVLPLGKNVYVAEKRGNRVRIETPMVGWMSLKTTDGHIILRRDHSQLGNSFNRSALNKVFQSKEAEAMDKNLRKTAATFNHLEQSLTESLKMLGERIGDHPLQKVGKSISDAAVDVKDGAVDATKSVAHEIQQKTSDAKALLSNKKVQVPREFGRFLGKF